MSKFLSADHLSMDDGIGIAIQIIQDNEEYLSTFYLSVPDRDVDIEEFHALIAGLKEARYKIEQLVEIFENGQDTE